MNDLLEHYRKKLGISEEEHQRNMETARRNSPLNDLNNVGQVEALQMQMIEQMGMMISMLTEKVTELEGKLNA